MKLIPILISLMLGVTAGGCASVLAPRPDRSKFFVLTPISDGIVPVASSASSAAPPSIGVGPVDFPDYLRRTQVVTRSAPNQIELSEERRWAEPLDKNFVRVLCENLAALLNTQRVERYPWPRKTALDYQVIVDVQHFERSTDGQSQLLARWSIRDARTGEVLVSSRTTASAPVATGEAGASAALSNDLAALSRDIAVQIAELGRHRMRTASAPSPIPHTDESAKALGDHG